MNAWQIALLVAYLSGSIALAAYAGHGLVLLVLFLRRFRTVAAEQARLLAESPPESVWPAVTTQIPLYNEADVAERAIRAAAALDYPPGRHEIQVLDDSDDACRAVVDAVAGELAAAGVDVQVLRRERRADYKAGALREGLEVARGSLVAIFDADFVPPADFLRRTVPLLLSDPGLAMVQGRWEHLNRDENWLTRAQAVGIDGHFAVEQGARAWNGLFMNFNGTAGVWRAEAIRAAGGWQGDTLTEDLDLSYRAQLAGWRMGYALPAACPAEIPATAGALKGQQRRWARGSMQTARKLLPRIWRSPGPVGPKLAATFHLTHYSVAIWMTALAVLAPAILVLVPIPRLSGWLWAAWAAVLLSAASPCLAYAAAGRVLGRPGPALRGIPALVVLGSGLCLSNAVAAVAGILGGPIPFERTPKRGGRSGRYRANPSRLWWIEILLGLYCAAGLAVYVAVEKWLIGFFLACYAAGLVAVGWSSRPRPTRAAAGVRRSPETELVPAVEESP